MRVFKISGGVSAKSCAAACRYFMRRASVIQTGEVGWNQTEGLVCLFKELELQLKRVEAEQWRSYTGEGQDQQLLVGSSV